MGPKLPAGSSWLCSAAFWSVLKLVFALYVASSVIYAFHRFYNTSAPTSANSPALAPGGSGKPVALPIERQTGTRQRYLSDAKLTNWARQRLFWTNAEDDSSGSVTPLPSDYLVGKVFGGLKPSKILPYYFKADPPSHYEDISVTTLVTEDRFSVLERMVEHYQAPVSVCIHINDDERKPQVMRNLHNLMARPMMRKYADVHIVIDNHDRQFNLWRNVARFFARTEFVMMLDIDFFLCTDIRHSVLRNPEKLRLMRERNAALVVPAYEFSNLEKGVDTRTFPRRKEDMLPLYRDGRLEMFHSSWVRGHNSTDYEKWTTADEVYKVVTYQFNYEPYVIMKKAGVAWCDERFIGYGSNKAACLFEIYLSGTEFWVLPHDFLIHQTHRYPEEARKQERMYNKKLYQNFREETCFKYARMLVAQRKWNTSSADNLNNECGAIPGFRQVMDSYTLS